MCVFDRRCMCAYRWPYHSLYSSGKRISPPTKWLSVNCLATGLWLRSFWTLVLCYQILIGCFILSKCGWHCELKCTGERIWSSFQTTFVNMLFSFIYPLTLVLFSFTVWLFLCLLLILFSFVVFEFNSRCIFSFSTHGLALYLLNLMEGKMKNLGGFWQMTKFIEEVEISFMGVAIIIPIIHVEIIRVMNTYHKMIFNGQVLCSWMPFLFSIVVHCGKCFKMLPHLYWVYLHKCSSFCDAMFVLFTCK